MAADRCASGFLCGLTLDQVKIVLEQARIGRLEIIDTMEKTLAAPRPEISKLAPRLVTVKINPEKIGKLIGPGGKMIRALQEKYGVEGVAFPGTSEALTALRNGNCLAYAYDDTLGVFNRSHYEDVLITRVHGWVSDKVVKQRFNQIKEFEELLYENGTTILKFFLHISKDEQKERLEERIRDPDKRWKFNEGDLEERKLWKDYMKAFEDVMTATSTDRAPWYIVPANRKWYRNLVVADRVVSVLEDLKLKTPPAPKGINFDTLKIV